METEFDGEGSPSEAATSGGQDLCHESLTDENEEIDADKDSQQPRPARPRFGRPEELIGGTNNLGLSQLVDNNLLTRISIFNNALHGMPHRLIQSSLNQNFANFSRMVIPPVTFSSQLPRISLPLHSPITNSFQELLDSLIPRWHVTLPNILETVIRPLPPVVSPGARLAVKLGWVVHNTLPQDVLNIEPEEQLDEAIMTYYTREWEMVKSEISARALSYLIDEDSKAVMLQALEAHGNGLYRLVPRSLIIEIERAVRVSLNNEIVDRRLRIKDKIIEGADDLPLSSLQELSSGMIQYETVENHLYEQIKDDEARLEFMDSPIPNRHAVVHGLVPYSSQKSSLNSIFLADFAFHLITEMKKEQLKEIVAILREYIQEEPSLG